jgi:hypothetical protein
MGVSTRFTGANIATVQEKTREVVVHQTTSAASA